MVSSDCSARRPAAPAPALGNWNYFRGSPLVKPGVAGFRPIGDNALGGRLLLGRDAERIFGAHPAVRSTRTSSPLMRPSASVSKRQGFWFN
jgi:hypothetical protein